MKTIRLAQKEDSSRLNEIWALCFGDGEEFRDFYFQERFQPDQTMVYLIEDEIVAMLTMIPVDLWKEGKNIALSMLYAIATHQEYQHQGIATELMDYAAEYQKSQGTKALVLVPAEPKLFPFYERQGYQEFFAVREKVWSTESIQAMPQSLSCEISPITPLEYNEIRQKFLQENFLLYGEEEVSYQKSISRFSGADIYALKIGGTVGCGAVERINEETLLFKELLLPPELVEIGVKGISELLPGKKYLVRTPVFPSGEWDENCRPFGLLKWITEGKELEKSRGSSWGYLGLAFD